MSRILLIAVSLLFSATLCAAELQYSDAVKLVNSSSLDEFLNRVAAEKIDIENIIVADYSRSSLLHLAMSSENSTVALWLIDNSKNLNRLNVRGETPLFLAATKGKTEYVRKLVEKGADVNLSGKDKYSPLMSAVMNGNYEVAEFLLNNGADQRVKSSYGYDALYYASYRDYSGSLAFMKTLLKHGADVNRKYGYAAETPLVIVVKKGQYDKARVLLDSGAKINEPDSYGNTPLHHAAYMNNKAGVDFLVSSGADLNIRNRNGDIPLHYSIRYGKYETPYVFKYYKDLNIKNSKKQNLLHLSIERNSITAFQDLSALNLDPEAEDVNLERPLHYAAKKNNMDFIDRLIAMKVSPDPRNKYGMTPLHISLSRTNINASKKLIYYGADITVKDSKSKSAYDYAVGNRYTFNRVRSDSYLNEYFLKSPFGSDYSAKARDEERRQWERERKERFGNILKYTVAYGLAIGNTAYSVYMHEEKYKDNPEDNPYGKGLSIGMGTVLCGAAGAVSLGALFVTLSDAKGLGQLGPMILGGGIGLVGGVIAGAYYGNKYKEDFAGNRYLYYGSTALLSVSIPLIVINF